MNKSTPEYIRVREEIAKKLCKMFGFTKWSSASSTTRNDWRNDAKSILEAKGIAILADNQTIPHGLTARLNLPDLEHYLYADTALNKANFKKVVR